MTKPHLNKYGHVVVPTLGLWQYSDSAIEQLESKKSIFAEKTKWVKTPNPPRFSFRYPITGELWLAAINRPTFIWTSLAQTKTNVQLWEQENGDIVCWVLRKDKKYNPQLVKESQDKPSSISAT